MGNSCFYEMTSGLAYKFLYGSGVTVSVYCAANFLLDHVAEFIVLTGRSMLPTFNVRGDGDLVIVEHVSTQLRSVRRGDVIIARSPEDPNCQICKRIIAMVLYSCPKCSNDSGDHIRTGPDGKHDVKIPKGHVWLLGDNPSDSKDSRDYGPVPLGLIRGRAFFKVWPLAEFGRIKNSFEDKWP